MCARSLTCKSHSMGAKRAVMGRSMRYDVLLAQYQKRNHARQHSECVLCGDAQADMSQGPQWKTRAAKTCWSKPRSTPKRRRRPLWLRSAATSPPIHSRVPSRWVRPSSTGSHPSPCGDATSVRDSSMHSTWP
jgi:hypothetical protein